MTELSNERLAFLSRWAEMSDDEISLKASEVRELLSLRQSHSTGVVEPGMRETMWAKVVFEGEDQSFLWECDEEGNRDGHHYEHEIIFDPSTFPVGTKIIVSEPVEE